MFAIQVAWSQEEAEPPSESIVVTERGEATEVAPGITVIVDPYATGPLEVASEIYYYPSMLSLAIAYDAEFTSFVIQLASRVPTRIHIEVTDPANLVPRAEAVVVPAGTDISVGFAAFAPHEGSIRLLNEEGDLLAAVPYTVTKQSRFEHSVSGFATNSMATNFDVTSFSSLSLGVGYRIRERSTGIAGSIQFEYSTDGSLNASGTISGSHTW